MRWYHSKPLIAQRRHPRPRQQAQARAPLARLWRQSAAMIGRSGRSPLQGSQSHARRAQPCKGSTQACSIYRVDATKRRSASQNLRQTTSGTLIGRPPCRPSTTFVAHLTRVSHTRRSAAHWRAIHPRTAARLWTGVPYSGACPPPTAPPPPYPQSGHPQLGAATSQRRTAERRRRGLTAPSQHLPAPPPCFFSSSQGSHRHHAQAVRPPPPSPPD